MRHVDLQIAQQHLRDALAYVKKGGAPRTADKIRSALKSVDGALRHADNDDARWARREGR